jgi:hypothetical protein
MACRDASINELRQWQWIGMLLARVSVGLVFAISGRFQAPASCSSALVVSRCRRRWLQPTLPQPIEAPPLSRRSSDPTFGKPVNCILPLSQAPSVDWYAGGTPNLYCAAFF